MKAIAILLRGFLLFQWNWVRTGIGYERVKEFDTDYETAKFQMSAIQHPGATVLYTPKTTSDALPKGKI